MKLPYKTALLLALFLAAIINTSAQEVTIDVAPTPRHVLPSASFTLTFFVHDIVGLRGANVIFGFNNSILRYTDATFGQFLGSTGGEVYGFRTLPGSAVNSVTVNQTINEESISVSGTGILFTATFEAIGTGTAHIAFTIVELRTTDNTYVPATCFNGLVIVGSPDPVYVDPSYSVANADGHEYGYDAFNTVTEGVAVVADGGTVIINPASYMENVDVSRDLTLRGVGEPTIQNLTFNTPSAILGGTIKIGGTLTLASGTLNTNTNKIIVTNNTASAVAITNGNIRGGIERAINAGSQDVYRFTSRSSYVKPDGNQGNCSITVICFPDAYPPLAPPGAVSRYYSIVPPAGFTAQELCLEYADAELNGIAELSLHLFRALGSGWVDAGGIPDMANNSVREFFISNWGMWTFGDGAQPLPVQLSSFMAREVDPNRVLLSWSTLSESNNYGYEVQRSMSGTTNFQTIENSFVAGNGTTIVPHSYSFIDQYATDDVQYYRLKQIDLDNTVHLSDPISVVRLTAVQELKSPEEFVLSQNYPNPFNPSTTIKFALPVDSYVNLNVYNTLGERVAELTNGAVQAGYHSVAFNAAQLASGIYVYRIIAKGSDQREFTKISKMILVK